jgi:pimeloyl-ACP methyl ester carboxylesterase
VEDDEFMTAVPARSRRWKMLWMLGVLIAAALLTTLCASCLVNKVVFHPQKGMQVDPSDYPDTQTVTILTEDDVRISAFYLYDSDASPTILFFHGNAGNASHRLDDADKLRALGANVLLVDYRSYGLSEGRPSESGVYRDAEASLEYLLEEKNQTLSRIFLYGRSLGSAVAAYLARDRKLGGVVLVSPFTSGRDMAFAAARPFVGDLFDTLGNVEHLKCPLLVIHGDQDDLIPIEMGQRVFDHATVEKQFVVIRGAGHNDIIQVNRHRFFSAIGELLNCSSAACQ